MKRWELLDQSALPGGQGMMSLHRRDRDLVIRVDGHELMSTRAHGSEDALGTLGVAPIAERAGARVLIGGLGMGFTLVAALAALGADAELTVAELVPAVIAWNRGPIAEATVPPGEVGPLDDPRTRLHEGDVAELIGDGAGGGGTRAGAWDAILLDVDNGPEGLTQAANDSLYGPRGLARAHAALTPGGVFAVWSASDDRAFARRLERAGFHVTTQPVHASGSRGRRHVVWIARRR